MSVFFKHPSLLFKDGDESLAERKTLATTSKQEGMLGNSQGFQRNNKEPMEKYKSFLSYEISMKRKYRFHKYRLL